MPRDLQLRLLHLNRPQSMTPSGRDGGVVGGGGGKLDGEEEGVGGNGLVGDDGARGEEVFV